MVAVRLYLRYGLSYRDVEELLVERGVDVDHVSVFPWVQRFTPLLADPARFDRHSSISGRALFASLNIYCGSSCLNRHPLPASVRRWAEGEMVSSEVPLYERDPEAWRAYLAEGNATQPRKRVSADAILRDRVGRLLLVDPRYKPDWDTPGGMAEANEPPHEAARRELREELGLDIHVGTLLVVDWVSPHGPWDDLLAFVFDGSVLRGEQVSGLRIVDDELAAFEFCTPEQARQRLRPHVWRRVARAFEALKTECVQYLQDGYANAGGR